MKIKFSAVPKEIGNSYMVVVPKSYFTNKILDPMTEYTFEVLSDE